MLDVVLNFTGWDSADMVAYSTGVPIFRKVGSFGKTEADAHWQLSEASMGIMDGYTVFSLIDPLMRPITTTVVLRQNIK